jgi:small conductance mechanosensitive channel
MYETLKHASLRLHDFYWILKPVAIVFAWLVIDRASQTLVRRISGAAEKRLLARVPEPQVQKTISYRMLTLNQLAQQGTRALLAVVMGLLLLDSIGINMRPVIAGVGIVGLGLSLAAQNIIRDYLNGFFILFEDQYNVGDFVTVTTGSGSFSGTVEYFSLRATKIRSLDGSLASIPNSSIQTVSNSTQTWSAAVVELGITYESDYKKAMDLAHKVADELASDKANMVSGTPDVQGINSFGDSAVVLRVILKTEAGQQWQLARLFRARVKDAFDANGIGLAYPQVVVHNAPDSDGNSK